MIFKLQWTFHKRIIFTFRGANGRVRDGSVIETFDCNFFCFVSTYALNTSMISIYE